MTEDTYTQNAEWYAALVADQGASGRDAVRTLLGRLRGGDVVDLASGIGSGLDVLRELGADRLFAVEPSRAMRAGLMTTICADPDLRDRTTVIPSGVPEALAALPRWWSGATMLNAIGHLEDEARHELWRALHERLLPGAALVLSLQPPSTVEEVPWTDFGTVRIGERELRTRGRADPLDEHHVSWTMEWTLITREGEHLETRTAEHRWRVLTPAQLATETGEHGLDLLADHAETGFCAVVQPS